VLSEVAGSSESDYSSSGVWEEYHAVIDGTLSWQYAVDTVTHEPISIPAGKKCMVQGYYISPGWTHGLDYTHSTQPPPTTAVTKYGPSGYVYPDDAPPQPFRVAQSGDLALLEGAPIGRLLVRLGSGAGEYGIGTVQTELQNEGLSELLVEAAMNDSQVFDGEGKLEGNEGTCGLTVWIEP
jgi:hypothetical protein